MRRAIAPIAAVLLVLTIAGPATADPTDKAQFPNLYVTTCSDGTVVPNQSPAHAAPGWGVDWTAGDTPYLLMGYTFHFADGSVYIHPLPLGLDGKVYGPCTITWENDRGVSITDAWYLKANQP